MKLLLNENDIHMVVSHSAHTLKVFQGTGKLMHETMALTSGVGGDASQVGGNTPLGDYKFTGELVKTMQSDDWGTWASYGPWFFGLYDMEGQETSLGRAGIGMHGGRQGAYAPDFHQPHLLYPTHGCIRVYDSFLEEFAVPVITAVWKQFHVAYVTVVE